MLHVETWYHFGALIHQFHSNAYFFKKPSTFTFAQLSRPKDIVYCPKEGFFVTILGCTIHIGHCPQEELTNFGYRLKENIKFSEFCYLWMTC
jgi:hypothetical protein